MKEKMTTLKFKKNREVIYLEKSDFWPCKALKAQDGTLHEITEAKIYPWGGEGDSWGESNSYAQTSLGFFNLEFEITGGVAGLEARVSLSEKSDAEISLAIESLINQRAFQLAINYYDTL